MPFLSPEMRGDHPLLGIQGRGQVLILQVPQGVLHQGPLNKILQVPKGVLHQGHLNKIYFYLKGNSTIGTLNEI